MLAKRFFAVTINLNSLNFWIRKEATFSNCEWMWIYSSTHHSKCYEPIFIKTNGNVTTLKALSIYGDKPYINIKSYKLPIFFHRDHINKLSPFAQAHERTSICLFIYTASVRVVFRQYQMHDILLSISRINWTHEHFNANWQWYFRWKCLCIGVFSLEWYQHRVYMRKEGETGFHPFSEVRVPGVTLSL